MWMYLYHLTVTQFGNPTALVQMPWYFGVAVTLQATAGTIVQVWTMSVQTSGQLNDYLIMLSASLSGAYLYYLSNVGTLPSYPEALP